MLSKMLSCEAVAVFAGAATGSRNIRPTKECARNRLRVMIACVITVGATVMGSSCGSTTMHRSPTLASRSPWLGLNDNSSAIAGGLRDFAIRGIVYNRADHIEPRAGETPADAPRFARGLRASFGAGMIPDIEVDPARGPPGCKGNPNPNLLFCLPTSQADIQSYIHGFIGTANSVLKVYPRKRVLFEPMNEPWDWASPPGTQSGSAGAVQYAAMLAQLLPAIKASHIPLNHIYVPATGLLNDGTQWIPDLYQAQHCLKPGPGSCGPIEGWNLHPYGLPSLSTEGIGSVPIVRQQMLSGQNNIIVSEVGFCAKDVAGGGGCDENRTDVDGTSAQAAAWLTKTLNEALPMHRAGWLKALLIWKRAGDAWAMQNADGTLTAQGVALDRFASRAQG